MPNVAASRPAGRTGGPAVYDDIDAITPCPSVPSDAGDASVSGVFVAGSPCDEGMAPYQDQHHPHHHGGGGQRPPSPTSTLSAASRTSSELSGRQRRSSLHRALEEGTGGDPERLWRKMLALQQIYGCYNSARMSAALESDDARLLLRKLLPLYSLPPPPPLVRTRPRSTPTSACADDALLLTAASKACLDLLNENMNLLPDDVERVLKPSK